MRGLPGQDRNQDRRARDVIVYYAVPFLLVAAPPIIGSKTAAAIIVLRISFLPGLAFLEYLPRVWAPERQTCQDLPVLTFDVVRLWSMAAKAASPPMVQRARKCHTMELGGLLPRILAGLKSAAAPAPKAPLR